MTDTPRDDIERAHLRDPGDRTFTIHRLAPPADLEPMARRYWLPVWDVPAGEESVQQVLQYPVCLLVVATEYARFYGVVRGLSRTVLAGRGYAVGVMLQPAAGYLVAGQPVSRLTDRFVGVEDVPGLAGRSLAERARRAVEPDPHDPDRQRAAYAAVEEALAELLPLDAEGQLVNELVDLVESDPELLRVDDLCSRLDLGERALQRLTARRLGLTPKWLIRRRRLHEATDRLRNGGTDLTTIAHELGYADQAHFSRDWSTATGMAPRDFAGWFRRRR